MRVAEYLEAREISYYTFAAEAGIGPETLRRVQLELSMPNGVIIRKIVLASRWTPAPCGGTVTADDLLDL